MIENTKKRKRGFISEEDISTVLQRYSATTVLALLQEVAQVPGEKFDWNAMVKKTSTGISNPREYQMLWRRLAYNTSLVERLNNEVEPLDDDSDLDFELEAIPTVAPEASAEAVACVKVLAASGMPSNSTLPNGSTVEAPLTINIPNGQSARVPSESLRPSSFVHGTNITVPVSVQKQPLPAVTSAEGLDTNGLASGNLPPRKKRKPWSAAEDLELIAAVKKFGEGNWANILKGDFKSERSASQLSQRWNIIRKRKGNSSLGGSSRLGGSSSLGGSSQLSEAQLAARRAMSLALNMPMTDKLKASSSRGGTTIMHHHAAKTSTSIKPEPQCEYDFQPTLTQRPEMFSPSSKPDSVAGAQRSGTLGPSVKGGAQRSIVLGLSSKSLVNLNSHSTKPFSDELVKATAVAAGARIVTPSDAVSLLKSSGNSLPSNVHYIRTGLATTLSTYSSAPPNDTRYAISHQMKPVGAAIHNNQRQTSPKLNVASEATKVATSSLVVEVETKSLEDIIPNSVDALEECALAGASTIRDNRNLIAFPRNAWQEQGQVEDLVKPVSLSSSSSEVGANDDQILNKCSVADDNHMLGFRANCDGEEKHVDMDICEDQSVSKKIDEQVPMDVCENLSLCVKQEGMETVVVGGDRDSGVGDHGR